MLLSGGKVSGWGWEMEGRLSIIHFKNTLIVESCEWINNKNKGNDWRREEGKMRMTEFIRHSIATLTNSLYVQTC